MTEIKNMTRVIGVVGEHSVGTPQCGFDISLHK
jgi:hypothetical protein